MQDFTKFPLGHRIDSELIVACPYSHRNAMRRESTVISFLHAITVSRTDPPQLFIDSCPKNSPLAPPNPKKRQTIELSRASMSGVDLSRP